MELPSLSLVEPTVSGSHPKPATAMGRCRGRDRAGGGTSIRVGGGGCGEVRVGCAPLADWPGGVQIDSHVPRTPPPPPLKAYCTQTLAYAQ